MKRLIYSGLVMMIIASLSACSGYNYYTAGLNTTKMYKYKTFAWMPMDNTATKSAGVGSAVADSKIKDATTEALQMKGLKLSQGSPDLIITYASMIGRGTRTNYYPMYYNPGFYPGFGLGYGWGFGYGFRSSYYAFGAPFAYYGGTIAGDKEHFKEGTLIIDMIDAQTKRVVWRGYGVGEVHKDPQKTVDDLPKVVDGIINQLNITTPGVKS